MQNTLLSESYNHVHLHVKLIFFFARYSYKQAYMYIQRARVVRRKTHFCNENKYFQQTFTLLSYIRTLHFVLRYGCNVMACFTNSCGLILLIRYNVDKLDTSLWLLEPLPSD